MATIEEKLALREKGMTYREIAKELGISYQAVAQALGGNDKTKFRPIDSERCIYPGLRKWLNDNKVCFAELARMMGQQNPHQAAQHLRAYLGGEAQIKIRSINKILKVTGLTYEEAFLKDGGLRCKDCKWYHEFKDFADCCHVRGLTNVSPNDFCSYGERKENG